MTQNKTKQRYKNIVRSGLFAESDITFFRASLNAYKRVSLNNHDRRELLEAFKQGGPYRIGQEQTKKGLAWILKVALKNNGQPRRSCPFNESQLDVIRNFRRFELVDLVDQTNSYALEKQYHCYMPVYRVHAVDGSYFDYYLTPDLEVHTGSVQVPVKGLKTKPTKAHTKKFRMVG